MKEKKKPMMFSNESWIQNLEEAGTLQLDELAIVLLAATEEGDSFQVVRYSFLVILVRLPVVSKWKNERTNDWMDGRMNENIKSPTNDQVFSLVLTASLSLAYYCSNTRLSIFICARQDSG